MPATAIALPLAPTVAAQPKVRALIVQDDEADALVCEATLRELGVQTRRASRADATRWLQAESAEVLVIDLCTEGDDSLDWTRSLASTPAMVFIASTESSCAASLETARAAGRLVVARPLDAVELANAVAFGLHQRARGRCGLTSDELGALHAIGTIASSALEPPEALRRMLGQVLAATGGDSGALIKVRHDCEQGGFTLAARVGPPLPPNHEGPAGHQGVCTWVSRSRRPLWLVGPLSAYPQFRDLAPNPAIGSSLVAPITFMDRVVGVLTVNSARPDGLAAEQLAFVASAAELVGILMHHLEADQGREHRQRLSMLGQMAASVAHELSNPVAFIRSNLEYVLGQLTRPAPGADGAQAAKEMIEILRESLDGVARISSLAADLKSMGRRDPGKRGPVSLEKVLRRCEVLVLARFKHRLSLTVDYGPGLTVDAEPEPLMQVFLNLLLNAAQVVPEREGRVTVKCRKEGNSAMVEVEDNGPGIPDSVASRLFEPFFTTRSEGTGLGLAISRDILHRYDGELGFTTEHGKGTRFFARMPLVPDKVVGPATLLVVDDDKALLKALVRVLKSNGYEARAATSVQEALASLAQAPVDAILTDFRMPGGTGADLVRDLRKQGTKIPAVLITANFEASEVQEALSEGLFVASVTKPWSQDDLLAVVAEMLSTRH